MLTFVAFLSVGNAEYEAEGPSKQEAHRLAAAQALVELLLTKRV